ncbi:MAG TPA: phosphate ABC transporter permease subunit PstC [Anaerolineales bacterium]|nr:phosphate ABC transporter permease subunit PstC [Anaerolineales bacterium]
MKKISVPQRNHWLARFQQSTHHGDALWSVLIIFASLILLALVIGIGWMLWQQSAEARIKFGWSFVLPTSNSTWDPDSGVFQAWAFVYGTLITSLLAILLAIPISVGIAIFLAELCPEAIRLPLNWMIELLAAIPSVVYGLWGIFIFLPKVVVPVGEGLATVFGQVPLLNSFFTGPIPLSGSSRLAASMILTIMIIPTVTAITRDVLLAIPNTQREAAMGMGSTRWEMIWQVLLPYGLSGILGAVILGLGRALGETMAVTMVIGNSLEATNSLLKPGSTMASLLANQFKEAVSQLHTDAMLEIGLTLFVITLILNLIARFLVWQVARRTPQEARA